MAQVRNRRESLGIEGDIQVTGNPTDGYQIKAEKGDMHHLWQMWVGDRSLTLRSDVCGSVRLNGKPLHFSEKRGDKATSLILGRKVTFVFP